MSDIEAYSFASSSTLELPVSIRINHLDGFQRPIPFSRFWNQPIIPHVGSNITSSSNLYVTVQLWADSKPLTIPVQTGYKHFKNSRTWNEWIRLPITYSNSPLSSQIAITLWDLSPNNGHGALGHHVPFGGTTVPLFNSNCTLNRGRHRCRVHRSRKADGLSSTTTPSISSTRYPVPGLSPPLELIPEDSYELDRLQELIKKHEMSELSSDQWLDPMVFRHVSHIEREMVKNMGQNSDLHILKLRSINTTTSSLQGASSDQQPECATADKISESSEFFLYVDLPRFDHPVVFTDQEYPAPLVSTSQSQHGSISDLQLKPPPEFTLGPGINENDSEIGRMIKVFDPEVGMKENPVENKHRRLVRNQRTGALDRDLKPNAKIRDELSGIIAYGPTQELKPEEKDLVWKFRHHLTRNKRALTKFVKSVAWNDSNEARQASQLLPKWTQIDVDDALELLGPSFVNPAVRTYAVDRLRKADDEELLLYLLQLVQALKFERKGSIETDQSAQDSSLAKFLISRAIGNVQLGNFLHWYLTVECDDRSPGQASEDRKLFAKVEYEFMSALAQLPSGQEHREMLRRQGEFITVLSKISRDIRDSKIDRIKKIDLLKKLLADPKNELLSLEQPLPLLLDPKIMITGCVPENSNVFKSTLRPLLITFKTSTGENYPVIFKTGDDLRQDQLVIQIITLMDRLLRKENLDLKLSPYRILAISTSAGAVQYIPSMSLGAIAIKFKGSLLAYLRANNPDELQPLGVRREAMDTYVKSCAGYCVVTYLLGVGDRHLDNLLITPAGRFFHADFGYILGRDPKPFAPLMKLSKEMIEGMGGAQSSYYQAFKQHCFTAYTTLRKSSNLILNLFSLMVDANVPDIRMESDKAVEKVRERFHLELKTEEEVIRMFEALMEDSISAMFPALIDFAHAALQRLRV